MNCFYTRLEQDSLLHITGPDTLKFLQGQTTCDTRIIDRDHGLLGIFCTPQGRVVCDFLLSELGVDHYALRMRHDVQSSSSAAFGKYIIFSKAQLDDTREDWKPYAVWGSDAAPTLTKLFGQLTTEPFGTVRGDGFVIVQTDHSGEQFECYLHDSYQRERLDKMMQLSNEAEWQALQMNNGVVRIEAATAGEFVPQTLNYDLTGHISFKKGCYTGQEVVARLHYLGKPKRRTGLAQLSAASNCAIGMTVYDAASDRNVGSIVNCCVVEGQTTVLVAATKDGLANGLRVGAADGPLLIPRELPYLLEPD